jgi:hypothetical protein
MLVKFGALLEIDGSNPRQEYVRIDLSYNEQQSRLELEINHRMMATKQSEAFDKTTPACFISYT